MDFLQSVSNWWFFLLIGFIFLYGAWTFLSYVGVKLRNKDSTYRFATFKIFDKWVGSFIVAIIVARIGFVLQKLSAVYKIGFFLLPYTKIQGHMYFFSYYPWRLLRFNEGIDYILLIVFWIVLIVLWFKSMAEKIGQIESSNEKLKHALLGKWFWGVVFLIFSSIFSVLSLYVYAHS